MSKQLAISSAVSIVIMAIFLLYGPSLAEHVGTLPPRGVDVPGLSELKALISN